MSFSRIPKILESDFSSLSLFKKFLKTLKYSLIDHVEGTTMRKLQV